MCGCLSHASHQRPGLQPRHVPWLGIELATLCFAVWCSIHWATPAQGCFAILNMCLLPHDPKWLLQFLPSNLQSSQEGEGRSGGHGLKIAHILSHLIGWSLVISPYYSKVSFRLYMGAPLKTLLLCKKEKLGSRGQLAVSLQEVSAQ